MVIIFHRKLYHMYAQFLFSRQGYNYANFFYMFLIFARRIKKKIRIAECSFEDEKK